MNKSLLVFAVSGVLLTSCGGRNEKYPNTGNAAYETMMGAMTSLSEVEVGNNYYTTSALIVRDENGNRLGLLSRHDKVTVVSLEGIAGKENYVQVTFRSMRYHNIQTANKYFVSFKYLLDRIEDYKDFNGKYFVIQNLATERLRVYEKSCDAKNVCLNKMVMETEMAIGEDTKETRSYVGSYRITDWWKFYQDHAAHYPSWYQDNYPMPPEAGSSFLKWFKSRYMPEVGGKKKGDMRGAFGWYTAWVGPNHYSQWTHGTVGWGSDKDALIKATKQTFTNIVANPRSSGCSRMNNEAIAYLREILPVGTPIIKVYAKEALLDGHRSNYPKKTAHWNYILTKNNAYSTTNFSADKEKVESRNIPMNRRLEEGTFVMDTYPTMFNFTDGDDLGSYEAKTNTTGNVYRVDESKMKGVLYVDAGLLEDYAHPQHEKIGKGGFRDEIAPDYMIMDKSIDKTLAVYIADKDQPENDNSGVEYHETVKVDTRGKADLSFEDEDFSTEISNLYITGSKVERDSSPAIRLQLDVGVFADFIMSPVEDDEWDLVVSNETLNSSNSKVKKFVKKFFKKGVSTPVDISVGKNEVTIKKNQGRNIEFTYKF